jgi:hypothetical protein
LPELEPPFRTITGSTRSTIAGRCNALGDGKESIATAGHLTHPDG